MKYTVKEAMVFENGRLNTRDFSFVSKDGAQGEVVSLHNIAIFPGFADVHVHFREPGFCYKETILNLYSFDIISKRCASCKDEI